MAQDPEIVPAGFFALRTPLLPFDVWLAWAGSDGDQLVAPSTQAERLRVGLRRLFRDPVVVEALQVASPSLLDAMARWERAPTTRRGRAVEHSLVSFLARMVSRPAPFGLFAGLSRGTIGSESLLRLPPLASYKRRTRLDMRYLLDLTDVLVQDRALRRELLYRPNSSLHLLGDTVRYLEPRRGKWLKDLRHYRTMSCDATPHLLETLRRADPGATRAVLVQGLIGGCESEADEIRAEAEAFVDELIDGGLLVADVQPTLTGPEPLLALIERLTALPSGSRTVDCLNNVGLALAEMDRDGLGLPRERYLTVAASLDGTVAKVDASRTFHVDLLKPLAGIELSRGVVDEFVRGIRVLHRLSPGGETPLARFKGTFRDRFGTRELPLVEALDEEFGLRFAPRPSVALPELIQGLRDSGPASAASVPWRDQDAALLKRVLAVLASGALELQLQEGDLRALEGTTQGPLLSAFSMSVTLMAPSAQALQDGRYRYFFDGYASAAALLGRFCQLDDLVREDVQAWLQREEQGEPDALFAEVVHLPVGENVGNVVCRPALRRHEIPFMGQSGVPLERQIPIDDLLISVRDDRFVLRSRRLGKEIRPRMSTAHAFVNEGNVSVYQFLCSLHAQSISDPLLWEWHPVLESLPFLPRLVAGRLILSPARWLVPREELEVLAKSLAADTLDPVVAWRQRRGLPRFVHVREGRQRRLLVDLSNSLSLASLLRETEGAGAAVVYEALPPAEELCVDGPEGRFHHDLIVPFLCHGPSSVASRERAPQLDVAEPTRSLTRQFSPGSEWLYLKLYAGASLLDRLLVDWVGPLVASLEARGAIDGWYFLRYEEPERHLRLRLHGCAEAMATVVLPTVLCGAESVLKRQLVWRVALDTYEREVERYGGEPALELSERIFSADSAAVLALLQGSNVDDQARGARWRLSLAAADALLVDFGLHPQQRLELVLRMRDAFHRELGLDKSSRHRVGERFRRERVSIEAALAPSTNEWWREILVKRSKAIVGPVAGLRELADAGLLTAPLERLCESHVHMHINRMLRTAQRLHEAVLYDFLCRSYVSANARRSASRATATP